MFSTLNTQSPVSFKAQFRPSIGSYWGRPLTRTEFIEAMQKESAEILASLSLAFEEAEKLAPHIGMPEDIFEVRFNTANTRAKILNGAGLSSNGAALHLSQKFPSGSTSETNVRLHEKGFLETTIRQLVGYVIGAKREASENIQEQVKAKMAELKPTLETQIKECQRLSPKDQIAGALYDEYSGFRTQA